MQKEFPLVSIIILNYNQLEVTCEFLESTKQLSYSNFEIILVDNASEINPTEEVHRRYPDVKVIVSKENLGFTGGNNLGIEAAQGEYFLIINNDTEVTEDLLERLLEPFHLSPEIGMVSPKIRYFQEPEIIQYAGYTPINSFTGRNRAIGSREVDRGQYNVSHETPYAHGAAMIVKRQVVEEVGMLPDLFFIYYEELDWSSQIRNKGYSIYYQADALVYHKESITMGKESAIKAYYHNRNRVLFMRRNTNALQWIGFLIFLLLLVIPKKTVTYLSKGRFTHLKALYRGLWWNIIHSKREIGSTIPKISRIVNFQAS